jgi:uncharacterized protein YfaT (DUF1175 family)
LQRIGKVKVILLVNSVSERKAHKIGLPNVYDKYFYNVIRESLIQSIRNPAVLSIALPIVLSIFISGCWGSSEARIERIERSDKGDKSPISLLGSDADRDGIPDAAELLTYDDRASFRRWFTSIAEMQFYKVSDAWTKEQRDCAGLVRFAWREALRHHDRLWFQAMGEGYEAVAPDVRAYTLDRSPLGEKLFRVDYGSYGESDAIFSEFADARTLKNHNAIFIGRDPRRAQPGDLLFFHQPWAQKFPYHVMIYLGEARHASEGASDWVIYHTGSSSSGSTGAEGEVKKVRLSTLNSHPDRRWRPVEKNRNFLGFYRLKILE